MSQALNNSNILRKKNQTKLLHPALGLPPPPLLLLCKHSTSDALGGEVWDSGRAARRGSAGVGWMTCLRLCPSPPSLSYIAALTALADTSIWKKSFKRPYVF